MGFTLKMKPLSEILEKRGLEPFGEVQRYVDDQVLRLNKPYIPFDNGILEKSGDIHTVVGSGEVQYNAPYAARLYYNPQYDFDTTAHPLAGGMWLEAMKTAHKKDILEGARKKSGAK